MLICVTAEASLVSGPGETVTRAPASACETFSFAGSQLGEVAASTGALCERWRTTSPTTPAIAASVRSPASRTRTIRRCLLRL